MEELKSLVQRAATGNLDAFGELVRRFQDMAYGYAYSLLGDFHWAQDAAQEAFIEAYHQLPRLHDPEAFPGWFRRIVFKQCDRITRARQGKIISLETVKDISAPCPTPPQTAEQREIQDKVLAAIGSLPDHQRTVTTLFYINGYSQADIAQFLEVPKTTVKKRLFNAKNHMQKELVAMVESELKKSRPDEQFTDRILRKITQIQVRPESKIGSSLLLTDSKGRSFVIMIGNPEALSIAPWLSGTGSRRATDIHTALVNILDQFGNKIEQVTIGELKAHTFYATLEMMSPNGKADIDCRPSDALNFALRGQAPIWVNKAVVDQSLIKGKGGKPMSPSAALRWFKKGEFKLPNDKVFRDIPHVIRALKKHPDYAPARMALVETVPGTKIRPAMIKNLDQGWATLHRWAADSEGGPHEALANGLLGSLYLTAPKVETQKAVTYLEKAHALKPEDHDIAFDLATAYAQAKEPEKSLTLIKKYQIKPGEYGNFHPLWNHPEFKAIAGEPNRKLKDWLFFSQLKFATGQRPKEAMKTKLPTVRGIPLPMTPIGQTQKQDLEHWLNTGPLSPINKGLMTWDKKKGGRMVLKQKSRKNIFVQLEENDFAMLNNAIQQIPMPRPLTLDSFCTVLKTAKINLDAVVLTKLRRTGLQAILVMNNGERQEKIDMDGLAALAVAFRTKNPVLAIEKIFKKN